jgi:hypothetical protein
MTVSTLPAQQSSTPRSLVRVRCSPSSPTLNSSVQAAEEEEIAVEELTEVRPRLQL